MKTVKRISTFSFKFIICVGIVFSASAFAGPSFVWLDANRDGVVSRDEAAAHPKLEAHFNQIDTNKDGVLSRAELKIAHQKKVAAKFDKLDKNQDGQIRREEAQSAPRLAKHFEMIDTSKDGYLSKEELSIAHAKLVIYKRQQQSMQQGTAQ